MKELKAREMLKELFERHNVPPIKLEFIPNPVTTKKEITTDLGGALTVSETMYGATLYNSLTKECWIEFYGRPTANTIRSEFKPYLEFLGKKYIRKSPTRKKKAEE